MKIKSLIKKSEQSCAIKSVVMIALLLLAATSGLANDVFFFTGSMYTPRSLNSATLLPNGKVLVIGGTTDFSSELETVEIYDPATRTFTPTGSMSAARHSHTATLLPNGKVLV